MTAPRKRPQGVRIFGKTYTISYEDPAVLQENLGLTFPTEQKILIADGQTPVEEADTVLHEVLHGVASAGNLSLSPENEERAVRVLASGLLGVLQDNPPFAEWLIQPRGPSLSEE